MGKSKKRKSRSRRRVKSRSRQKSQVENNKQLLLARGIRKIRKLLKAGANVNTKDKNGETALMDASWDNKKNIVKLLLKAGADPNIKDKDNWTALIYASDRGNTEIVKLLLKAGANPNIQISKDGNTPLMLASRDNMKNIVALLIAAGANPNIKNKNGDNALSPATWKGHTEIVRLLLDGGADMDKQDTWWAGIRGHTKVVKLLKREQIKRQTKKHMRRQRDRKNLHKKLKSRWGNKYPYLQGRVAEYLFN